MKNFVQDGAIVTITAAATITAGDLVEAGTLHGVALNDAVSGDALPIATEGVFNLPKEATADTFAAGAEVQWDSGNARVIALAAGTRIGVVTQAAIAADATVAVKLLPK